MSLYERPSNIGTGTPGVAATIFALFGFLVLVYAFAAASAWVTATSVDGWYLKLNKPSLTPEGWVFPVVWNVLYFMMGLAAWLVWRKAGGFNAAGAPLAVFGTQMALNFTWSVMFFGLQAPGWASLEILILFAGIVLTIRMFTRVSRLAALLMLPYLAWVGFASYLCIGIWLLNHRA